MLLWLLQSVEHFQEACDTPLTTYLHIIQQLQHIA
jgi:hypothetical protein